MEDTFADIRRLLAGAGLYAAAGVAQRGLSFLLLPLYTRLIDPAEYGVLEILNAFSSMLFVLLTIGLVPAINKCYHRDCDSSADQSTLLGTALLLDLPILGAGCAALIVFARPIATWLVGDAAAASLMVPVALTAGLYGVGTLVLATLRAQERAAAFSVLTLVQFVTALACNVVFVVYWGWGIRGILYGNLLSHLVSLPLMWLVVRRGSVFAFNRRLVRPLLTFGTALVPLMLTGWVMDLSDRYLLRTFRGLDELALYGVGYKVGMVVELLVVWPFQLAWPAFSFAISNRPGHRETYARTLTYLSATLALVVLLLVLPGQAILELVIGPRYREAFRVVPAVALAYAFNGIQYCVSPGIHLARRTRLVPLLAGIAALVNVGLNLVLIPRFGMLGAAWATTLAYAALALAAGVLAQQSYPVSFEYRRLAKVVAGTVTVYLACLAWDPDDGLTALAWSGGVVLVGFPLILASLGFFESEERVQLRSMVARAAGVASR